MSQITVLTGPERRRRWRPEDKLRVLAEAFSPGGCVGAVARRHDVSRGLIYTWRRKLRRELTQPAPAFAAAVLAQEPNQAPADRKSPRLDSRTLCSSRMPASACTQKTSRKPHYNILSTNNTH